MNSWYVKSLLAVIAISLTVIATTAATGRQLLTAPDHQVNVLSLGIPKNYDTTRTNTLNNIVQGIAVVMVKRGTIEIPCVVTLREAKVNNYEPSGISCGWTTDAINQVIK